MLDTIFGSIFWDGTQNTVTAASFFICVAVALALGALLAFAYAFKNRQSKSLIVTLGLLPAVVCVIIMLVNGNIGAGVAVAGAFSLVRFRSAPGSAKEIISLFIAMCVGLTLGMGLIGYAVAFTLIMSVILLLLNVVKLPVKRSACRDKILRITIPEDLDYTGIFEDVFNEYTEKSEQLSVKTTNMGSMFKLSYAVTLKDASKEKQFIDALRCRNGNLEISLSNREDKNNEL